MKKIVFDLACSQPVGNIKFHGGGEYVKSIFDYITKNYKNKMCLFEFCYNPNLFLDEWIIERLHSIDASCIEVDSFDGLIDYLNSKKEDCLFFTGLPVFYSSRIIDSKAYRIGTIHGLRDIEMPMDKYTLLYGDMKFKIKEMIKKILFPYFRIRDKKRISNAINNLDYIINDSTHSSYAMRILFSKETANKKMAVLYPSTELIDYEDIKPDGTDKNFIMIISANRWIKNSYRALMAIDQLYTKGLLPNMRTKVFGGLPKSIRKRIKNISMYDFYDYVDKTELETAFMECSLFLYPTLNEGFGNVPMQAMKYGKTCSISAVCSLTEVYGDSVYYFNPYSIEEIQNRILQGLSNKIEFEKIKERMFYLLNRQQEDMVKTCQILLGNADE